MVVSELTDRLSIFYHISGTDQVLIRITDKSAGTSKYYNVLDMFKVQVEGRQLPVLVPGDTELSPDVVDGKVAILPLNGAVKWSCQHCGMLIDKHDKFCKHCGKQLTDK